MVLSLALDKAKAVKTLVEVIPTEDVNRREVRRRRTMEKLLFPEVFEGITRRARLGMRR